MLTALLLSITGAYIPWLEPQPSWSAFRQSTFGTGLLTVHNASHAWYNWTRAACVSLNDTSDFVSLDGAGCVTEDRVRGTDNSEQPQQPSDGVWIIRDLARDVACVPVQCAPDPPPNGSRVEEESKLPEAVVGDNGIPEVEEPSGNANEDAPAPPPRGACLGASAVHGLVAGVVISVFVCGVLAGAALATLRTRCQKQKKRRTRGVEIITGPLQEMSERQGRANSPTVSNHASVAAVRPHATHGWVAQPREPTKSGGVGDRVTCSEVV